MTDFTTSKVDGNTVGAAEWNQLADIDNSITSSGQTPSTGNLNQTGIAMAINAAVADFYSDSGAADAYVLTAINSLRSPNAYIDGMRVRFRPDNANTGASTVNVATLGVKSIKKADYTTALVAGDIPAGADAELRYDTANGVFVLCPSSTATLRLNSISNKNAVINGDFNIWQRGTSFTSIADATYSADRWVYNKVGAAVHDVSRSTDVPTVAQAGRLFNYSTLIDCTTADASIAAGDYVTYTQKIEGYDWLPLAQKAVTLSFWVKGTKTGIHCASLRNSGTDRSYVCEFTINVTDAWELKTCTFTASPSAGTWDYTTGIGVYLTICLSAGSTFQTTAGAWQTGNFFATSNQVNATDSTSNNFRICSVQLEVGSVATAFEQKMIQEELSLCQRYFHKSFAMNTTPAQNAGATGVVEFPQVVAAATALSSSGGRAFPVRMRTAPTIVMYNPSAANAEIRNGSIGADFSSSASGANEHSVGFSGTSPGGSVAGNQCYIHYTASAEL